MEPKQRPRIKPGLRVLLIGEALILTAAAMFGPIQALFVSEVGGSLLDAGYAGSVFSLAAGIVTLAAGHFTDKAKQPKAIISLGYGLTALGFFLLMFVNSIWQLLVVQLVIGIATPLYVPAFNALYTRQLNRDYEGSEWSLWDATDYFTAAVGAIIGGLIATHLGFDALFLIMALVSTTSAIFIFLVPSTVLGR